MKKSDKNILFLFLVLAGIFFVSAALTAPASILFTGNVTAFYDEGNFIINWTSGGGDPELSYSIYISTDGGTSFYVKDSNDSVLGYSFSNTTDANYTFIIGSVNSTAEVNSTLYNMSVDTTAPVITLPVYVNGTAKKNTDLFTLNISVNDAKSGLTGGHCVLSINGTNETVLISSGWCNTTSLNLTNLADGNHTINVYANDTINNFGLNKSLVVQVDTTAPTGSFSCSPSVVNEGGEVVCSCSSSDATSGINGSWTSYVSNPSTGSTGTFLLTCDFRDYAGNRGNATASYTVNGVSSGSSSGGTSSGSKGTFEISQNQFQEGYTRTLTAGQRIRLNYNNEEHHVSVLNLEGNVIKIEISSDPVEANLAVGDIRKFDLDGDGTYDLQVVLNSIEYSYADLTIVKISESITKESESDQRSQESEATGVSVDEEPLTEDNSWSFWIVLGIVILVIFIYFYFNKRND